MRRPLPTLLLLALATAALPAAAEARTGPCIPGAAGPTCHVWTGKITYVDDGDTVDVNLTGGSKRSVRVRVAGIQTMELTRYSKVASRRRGACHAREAAARVDRLARASGGRARLTAQVPGSSSRGRPLRSVAVRIGGRWRDLGRTLVAEGHALWLPDLDEWAWNRTYSALSRRARAASANLFDGNFCGSGPSPRSPLSVWVNWDDDGDIDAGEWVRVKNHDPVNDVSLRGWWLRDSALRRYRFPSDARVPAGGTVTLYTGHGSRTASSFFWGLGAQAFPNPTRDEKANGDGAYLFDPQGDVRASMIYPCRDDCLDPSAGSVQLVANPRRPEYVTIANRGARPFDLESYRLATRYDGYSFGPDSVLAPGETMRVDILGDQAAGSRLQRYWGKRRYVLDDQSGSVRIAAYDNSVLACTDWGRSSDCP